LLYKFSFSGQDSRMSRTAASYFVVWEITVQPHVTSKSWLRELTPTDISSFTGTKWRATRKQKNDVYMWPCLRRPRDFLGFTSYFTIQEPPLGVKKIRTRVTPAGESFL
jgi:hypothetical protein